jgi:hypothetical protein
MNPTLNRTLLLDTIKVLESCEAKLEYMGNHRVGTRDAPDCLHRAEKARDMIATLRSVIETGADK